MTLDEAIQEFEDYAFHNSIKPEISEQAKAIALRCMIIIQSQNISLQKVKAYKRETGYYKRTLEEIHKQKQ